MEKMKDKYFPKDIDVLGSFLTYTLTIGRFYVEVEINTALELASTKVELLFNSENEEDEKLMKSLPKPACVNKDSFKKHKYYYIFKEVSEFKSFINELKEKSV